jgi:hypothetical protein
MATSDLERLLDDWATAWSSSDSSDPERVLALFVDNCVFEDVTFGVVVRGREELLSFVNGAFAAVPRLQIWNQKPICCWPMGYYRVGHVGHS